MGVWMIDDAVRDTGAACLPRKKSNLRGSRRERAREAEPNGAPALAALAAEHAPALFRLAFSLTGNATDAEDVVQETFLAAFEGWGRFEGRSSARTWLMSILVRKAARHRRYSKLRRTLSLDGLSGIVRSAFGHAPPTGELRKQQIQLDIESIFASLSPEHREVLALREIEGMSYAEMAAALGVPIGTIESRLHRARQQVRAQFKDYFA